MRTLPAIVAPGLLLAALAGCADEPGGPEAAPPGEGLVGLTFVSTAVTVDERPRPLAAGTRLRIEFAGDQLSVDAGCNHLFGTVSYADDVLRVDGMGGTEMGCDPARMDQDAWLSGFLADDPHYVLDGDTLTLTHAARTAITLEPEPAEPAADLVGSAPRSS